MNHIASASSNSIASQQLCPATEKNWFRFLASFLVCYSLVVIPILTSVIVVSTSRIVTAEFALAAGEHLDALKLAKQELRAHPDSDRALLIAGSASMATRNYSFARQMFIRVSSANPQWFSLAKFKLGQIAMKAGRAVEAEEQFRSSLAIDSHKPEVSDTLTHLLILEGRSWEARQLVIEQFRRGNVTTDHLMALATVRPVLDHSKNFAKQCLTAVPDESLPRLAVAKQAWTDHFFDEAREQIHFVLIQHPKLLEAHAVWLQILVDSGTDDEFRQAVAKLPPDAALHPEIWIPLGIWAENHQQLEAAARCYWEALRLDPNFADANYRLAQILVTLKRPDDARPFAVRSELLTQFSLDFEMFARAQLESQQPQEASSNEVANKEKTDQRRSSETVPPAVHQLERLGRDWEAAGWCQIQLLQEKAPPGWARSKFLEIYPRLLKSDSLGIPSQRISQQVDLSSYPLPAFNSTLSRETLPQNIESRLGTISFQEESERVGIHFTYLNGASNDDRESLLEMNGGGIAVLDYDCDHWPDLYLTQGGRLPPAPFDPAIHDRLYRNCRSSTETTVEREFEDVTAAARLTDLGYGQGVTAGDFDNDGFPDLYVGNIGRNPFFRNNGDGTFTDIAISTGTEANVWTSSAVFADLNRDGFQDLYVVTYLAGRNCYESCSKHATERCAPTLNPAEPDRFYLNQGDGGFRDHSNSFGLEAPQGRGLGVVAADFDGSHRLSLFVANDMSANFYFHNQTISADAPQFEEQGLLAGLALDHLGRIHASMGVATGDYNGDGRLDLFVTNFYRASKVLYAQQEDGSFRDVSREARLFYPGFLMLGWGTQFLDANLDGNLDLIVANGHVHDPLEQGVPYAMLPQFFRNHGDSTYVELPGSQLGEYFCRPWHGRPLARLDWNRDGLEDVCITHLNQPLALLTNTSTQHGHFVAVRLVAVDSARDAIGTSVKVVSGRLAWTQQLTAGDGFQASNQRQLVFGVGELTTIDSLEVIWPSGTRQEFRNLKTDREWLLIEHHQMIELNDVVRQSAQ